MKKLNQLVLRYGTTRNLQVLYILLALVAVAIAGGAPAGSGGN